MNTTITEKDKKLLVVLSCILLLVVFGMFVINPLVTKGMEMSDKVLDKENDKQIMEGKILRHDALQMEVKESAKEIDNEAEGMYPYMAANDIDNIITKLCVAEGLQIDGMKIEIEEDPMWIIPFLNSEMAKGSGKETDETTETTTEDEGAMKEAEAAETDSASSSVNKPEGATVETKKIYIGKVTLDASGALAPIMNLNTKVGADKSMRITEMTLGKADDGGLVKLNLKVDIYMYREAKNK